MNKSWIICVGAILIILVGFVALSHNNDTDTTDTVTDFVEEKPIPSSEGKVATSSNLTLYYNNDPSVYGYFIDNVFQGIAYYDDAILKGTVNLDLSDVKWDKNYTPYSGYENNVSYAKEHFLKDVKKDYKNGDVDINVRMEFYDKDGKSVDLYELTDYDESDGKKAIDMKLKGDTLKLKIKHRFHTNETIISNDIPYDGALSKEPGDYHKTYKAKLRVTFENNGKYDYTLRSTLKDDKFYIIHT